MSVLGTVFLTAAVEPSPLPLEIPSAVRWPHSPLSAHPYTVIPVPRKLFLLIPLALLTHPLSLSFNSPSSMRPSQVSLEGPPLDQLSGQAGCQSSYLKSAFSLPVSALIAGVNVVWKLGAGGWEHPEKHHGPWLIQTSFLPTGDASTDENVSDLT